MFVHWIGWHITQHPQCIWVLKNVSSKYCTFLHCTFTILAPEMKPKQFWISLLNDSNCSFIRCNNVTFERSTPVMTVCLEHRQKEWYKQSRDFFQMIKQQIYCLKLKASWLSNNDWWWIWISAHLVALLDTFEENWLYTSTLF